MTKIITDLLLQFCCASCVLVVAVIGQNPLYDRTCTLETRQRNGVCGDSLRELLDTVCGGRFNSWMKKRGNVNGLSHVQYIPDKIKKDLKHNLKESLLSKSDAYSFLAKRAYNPGLTVQNINCECCVHQCQFFELRGYCEGGGMFFKRSDKSAIPSMKGALLQMISSSNTRAGHPDE